MGSDIVTFLLGCAVGATTTPSEKTIVQSMHPKEIIGVLNPIQRLNLLKALLDTKGFEPLLQRTCETLDKNSLTPNTFKKKILESVTHQITELEAEEARQWEETVNWLGKLFCYCILPVVCTLWLMNFAMQ